MGVVLLLYLIVEVVAIWAVASVVGALWTILLLLAGAIVGSWLARREGGKAMRAVMAAAQAGRSGHQEITDGMLVALGGVLIFLPGFVTDVLGVLAMVPPTRTALRRAWLRRLERTAGNVRYGRRVVVVDGQVVEDKAYDTSYGGARERREDDGDDGPPRVIEG
ncbi:FxsA family protein [Haloechinothrix salitolerans]|uniref:FxsA family protein n=1 Tax=Haloechinothrix salitolerans TaxID=926830 RepID=A0ABW2BV92_9PSEU